jgi:hypothetical protein
MGNLVMVKGWLLALLLAGLGGLLGSGCATTPVARPTPPQALPAAAAPAPPSLLDDMAACHMLRVSQTRDPAVTDAVVVAALRQFKVSPQQVAGRAVALVPQAQAMGQGFEAVAQAACDRLAGYTGVQSITVRARVAPKPQGTGSVGSGGVWLRYEGEIGAGLADKVAARIAREGAVGLIINSQGGDVAEARRLGRYLRANGLKVAVDRVCASACIDVLAGGVVRYVTKTARIGVHQSSAPSSVGTHNTGQSYVAGSAYYLREMGVDPGVALAAASIPPNKIYWIPSAEVMRTRLATNLITSL